MNKSKWEVWNDSSSDAVILTCWRGVSAVANRRGVAWLVIVVLPTVAGTHSDDILMKYSQRRENQAAAEI